MRLGSIRLVHMYFVVTQLVTFSNQNKLLTIAAAAALLRGGPMIPLAARFKVPQQQTKVVHYPVHYPVHVPVHIPVHHHSQHVKVIHVPVHHYSHSEKHHLHQPIYHHNVEVQQPQHHHHHHHQHHNHHRNNANNPEHYYQVGDVLTHGLLQDAYGNDREGYEGQNADYGAHHSVFERGYRNYDSGYGDNGEMHYGY